MSSSPHESPVDSALPRLARIRYRLRFQKIDDMRWIGHLDLARAIERWFRRAALPLSMSEGFHPTPRINIPSALGLGISGWNEVLEFELTQLLPTMELLDALKAKAPPGLHCLSLERRPEGTPKVRIESARYSVDVPPPWHSAAERAEQLFRGNEDLHVFRANRGKYLDLREHLQTLAYTAGVFTFEVNMTLSQGIRPAEVLEGLGLSDLVEEGLEIRRDHLQLADDGKAVLEETLELAAAASLHEYQQNKEL